MAAYHFWLVSIMGILKDQVALVTGASRGIGRAIALEFAREGASVLVNYNNSKELAESLVQEIEDLGGKAACFQADVAQEEQVDEMVAFTISELGKIDILVCNAGVVKDQLMGFMNLDEWEQVVKTNLTGTFVTMKACLRHMMRNKKGSIINISSIAATRGGRGHANYAASKGGINSLTISAAIELAPKRIRVNAIAPGVIDTDMTERVQNLAKEEILQNIPLKQIGVPQDVANLAAFLASEKASYITGEIINVNGGMGLGS